MKINTLDYQLYQKIQQTLIDTLDTAEWVSVKGKGANETDLRIHLHTLTDPAKQSNFENCVADVNIPVGEVLLPGPFQNRRSSSCKPGISGRPSVSVI